MNNPIVHKYTPRPITFLNKSNEFAIQVISLVGNSLTQWQLADILTQLNVVSASGKPLSASHVSNFLRKTMNNRRVKKYGKDNYKCNHITYPYYHDIVYASIHAQMPV